MEPTQDDLAWSLAHDFITGIVGRQWDDDLDRKQITIAKRFLGRYTHETIMGAARACISGELPCLGWRQITPPSLYYLTDDRLTRDGVTSILHEYESRMMAREYRHRSEIVTAFLTREGGYFE